MDQVTGLKLINFCKCKTCIYKDLADTEEPCCDCLEIPAREYSHTPEYYKKKEN